MMQSVEKTNVTRINCLTQNCSRGIFKGFCQSFWSPKLSTRVRHNSTTKYHPFAWHLIPGVEMKLMACEPLLLNGSSSSQRCQAFLMSKVSYPSKISPIHSITISSLIWSGERRACSHRERRAMDVEGSRRAWLPCVRIGGGDRFSRFCWDLH